MGTKEKDQSGGKPGASATENLSTKAVSAPRRDGRRVLLKFINDDNPQLDRIEFRWSQASKIRYWQQGAPPKNNPMTWSEVPQALSLLFLDYLCAGPEIGGPVQFLEANGGTLVTALGNALSDRNRRLHELFVESIPPAFPTDRTSNLFAGKFHGKGGGERRIWIQADNLPADCIDVVWMIHGHKPINDIQVLWELGRRIRQSLGIPGAPPRPTIQPKPPEQIKKPPTAPEQPISAPKTASELFGPANVQPDSPKKDSLEPSLEKERGKLSSWLVGEIRSVFTTLKQDSKAKAPETTSRPAAPTQKPAIIVAKEPELPAIDPRLFEVQDRGGFWPDHAPILEFSDGETGYPWTLKQAFEGVIVFGRTGSGKTTGAGFTLAESFLRSGFGGLVLTVKRNEADHWRRLCAYCGREDDLVVVERGGAWKLNVLAYEAQCAGRGAGLAENLTNFCRNLLEISSRSHGESNNDKIWKEAGDQLLNSTFELFLLAGETITFDRLANFIASAPTEFVPETEDEWLKIPVFGQVLLKAKQSRASLEDERLFAKAANYWFTNYRTLNSKTRTSVTLGIYAMLDAFRGRDVPALISSETNVTPEHIMSGKIVVLDLPLKELRHTGLMVQSAWKYLFQTALERQKSANSPQRRPVFLWEDEGQYFFSNHDPHFQDTARSSRVCRVILTQNLPGFYKELGRQGPHIADSVFGNLNTKIFCNNSDPITNEWASKHFGMVIRTRYSITQGPPPQPRGLFDIIQENVAPQSRTSVSGQENWEYAVRPEEFNNLRTGGPENDFLVEAYVTWMGLSDEQGRHFILTPFLQNKDL